MKYHFDFFRKKYFFMKYHNDTTPGDYKFHKKKIRTVRHNNETARIFLNLRVNNLFTTPKPPNR